MSKNVLLTVVVALAAAIAGGFLLWSREATSPGPAEGRAIAEMFLSRLEGGDAEAAWESTTAEFKSAEGATKFVTRVKNNAWVREPMTFSSVQQVKVNDSDRLEFAFTSSKTGKFVRILLARDQGAWRVDRLTF